MWSAPVGLGAKRVRTDIRASEAEGFRQVKSLTRAVPRGSLTFETQQARLHTSRSTMIEWGRAEWLVRNETRGTVVAERVAIAASMATRLRGLLGTTSLPRGHGLLIRPCRQVHSFFMRNPLDLVFLDWNDRVLRTVAGFARNRVSPFVRGARAVLELPAGTLADTQTGAGDVLRFVRGASTAEREADVA
jgi:hypothetical protein